MDAPRNTILQGDALAMLKTLPDECVQTVVTSPPYWGLRDYGADGQIGLEPTLAEYVAKMVELFAEVWRVLRKDGTLWLNMGDSYARSGGTQGGGNRALLHMDGQQRRMTRIPDGSGLKDKDLCGVPWRVAFALQDAGWWLRSDIIWMPNPMPESVTDRPTRSHEYIFLLTRSQRYYYDAAAIREPLAAKTYTTFGADFTPQQNDALGGVKSANWNGSMKKHQPKVWADAPARAAYRQRGHSRRHAGFNDRWDLMSKEEQQALGANKRDVWTVATHPFPEAHFATFPPALIEPCILSGSRPGDLILDPFMGSGTTATVAVKHLRDYLGIELNPDYIAMANRRLGRVQTSFLSLVV